MTNLKETDTKQHTSSDITCDVCGEKLTKPKEGIEIFGENINVEWAGPKSPAGDPFKGNGMQAPMNGRISLTVCKVCLVDCLELPPPLAR